MDAFENMDTSSDGEQKLQQQLLTFSPFHLVCILEKKKSLLPQLIFEEKTMEEKSLNCAVIYSSPLNSSTEHVCLLLWGQLRLVPCWKWHKFVSGFRPSQITVKNYYRKAPQGSSRLDTDMFSFHPINRKQCVSEKGLSSHFHSCSTAVNVIMSYRGNTKATFTNISKNWCALSLVLQQIPTTGKSR